MRRWTVPPPADAWPETDEAHRVRGLWAPMLEHGTAWAASNVHADAALLIGGGHVLPVTVTRAYPENSYVVSAVALYLHYGRYEAERLPAGAARRGALALLRLAAPLLRRLDPVVMLDNAPVSTVLRVERPAQVWAAALETARQAWPGRPVVVRSLDAFGSKTLASLDGLGFDRVLTRRVFFQDASDPALWQHRDIVRDAHLVSAHPLPWRPLAPADAGEVARLYWMLYGERYTPLNPRFTADWLAHGLASGALRGEGLTHDGRLVAVYGSIEAAGVVTQPVFGYDTALPAALGLYRRLSLRALERARERGLLQHASAGAGRFKRSRGGVPCDEYAAVHLAGCPPAQARAWRALARIARGVGPALLARAD